MLKGSTKRPDILVLEPNVSPVVIETEVLPAVTVEMEAITRPNKCAPLDEQFFHLLPCACRQDCEQSIAHHFGMI
jgi:hypothetical protein